MDKLDYHSIDWEKLSTNHGTAARVPRALEGLTSEDPEERRRSYFGLDNVVVLQSDLSEAACAVVPFLIEMLRRRPTYGRDLIYDLLFEIANGYAPDDYLWNTADGRKILLRVACLEEVKKGVEVFGRDLADPDESVRSQASELLELIQYKQEEGGAG
jgi:hypothetical protein